MTANRTQLLPLVDVRHEATATLEAVEAGIKHVIADVISKDAMLVAYMKAG